MGQMDILDTHIKGITARIIGWLISGVASIIVFGMLLWFGITTGMKDMEGRLTTTIKEVQHKQELTDTIQNRDISDLKGRFATIIIK